MFMPERVTMHLRNKQVIVTVVFLLLGATSLWATQGQTTQPQQNQQRVQPTPIPSDIDPSDPALPSWAKPALPPSGAANVSKPATTPVPTGRQPGQQQPLPGSAVGEVTKNDGQYTYRSQVNEVTLSAVVLDARKHLITNLARTNFAVYGTTSRRRLPRSVGKTYRSLSESWWIIPAQCAPSVPRSPRPF